MSYPQVSHGSEEEAFNEYSTERFPVGSKMELVDGRIFRHCEAANAALVAGNMSQGAVIHATNYLDEAVGTLDAGVFVLTGVGSTGANMVIDLLKYGYVYSSNETDLPLMRCKSNTLITASAVTGTITLFTPTPSAITVDCTISYFANPWRDVIISASPATAIYTGVCKRALSANYYGWVQTTGPVSMLYDTGTTAIASINYPVVGSVSAIDGACEGVAAGTTETDPIFGTSLGPIEGNTEQTTVFLRLE